jgi:cobalt/nickel transport system permease protein
MHLPDGFLDAKTSVLATAAAVAGLGLALRQMRSTLEPRQVPMLGLASAFVFAAQMLNFPVVGGTSGHLLGGVLTAVLLGPSAAVVVMTSVLIVQCLMFSDGGLLVLGANVFNLAIVSVCGGYLAFRLVRRVVPMEARRSTVCAAAFGAWFGTVLASISCAGQIAFSGTAAWGMVFPAMANVHMLIGLGEGLATGLVTMAVMRTRPELVWSCASRRGEQDPNGGPRDWIPWGYGLVVAVGLAVFVGPFACPWPDGLDRVARTLGFEARAADPALASPMPDYQWPFVGSATAATAMAGLIGTVVAFAAAYGLARVLVPALGPSKKDARTAH